jgi:Protein of unknown function (DUF2384)
MLSQYSLMAVGFLQPSLGGYNEQELAVSNALKRSAPLLLVNDSFFQTADVQRIILFVYPRRDYPMALVHDDVFRDEAPLFAAIVVVDGRTSLSDELLDSNILPRIRENMELRADASVPLPIFYFDQTADSRVPEPLREMLKQLADEMPPIETLSLPLFIEAAGGEQRANTLVDTAVERRFSGEESGRENFAVEARSALKAATEVWSMDSAISWLRSANAFLSGSRPIDLLTLEGPRRVADAAWAAAWGAFA